MVIETDLPAMPGCPLPRRETHVSTPVHLRLKGRIDTATERLALRAALTAAHLFGLGAGTHLRWRRGSKDPLVSLQAELQEAELRASVAWDVVEMLVARFGKLPEKRRPHFSPEERFRALEIKNLLGWSARETARWLLVCQNTILNWENASDPEARAVGSTVKPTPPIRRAHDVVQRVAQTMARLGFGGQDMVARVLARAGWKVSARSVARYRRTRLGPAAPPDEPARPSNPVVTRFVHHAWMLDVTRVKRLLGPDVFVAAVFEAHARVPLALRFFDAMPGARDMAALFRQTVKAFETPRYVITDLGGEFAGEAFRTAVTHLGTLHRFAAADSIKATARLERFWRSLKDSAGLRGLSLPLTITDLERRLETALLHYVCFRPHEGLGGATPLEVFLDCEPAHLRAVEPPRGGPGDPAIDVPFRFGFLDREERLPVLVPSS